MNDQSVLELAEFVTSLMEKQGIYVSVSPAWLAYPQDKTKAEDTTPSYKRVVVDGDLDMETIAREILKKLEER